MKSLTFRAVKACTFSVRFALAAFFPLTANAAPTSDEIVAAMKRATTYYAGEVALNGGYVYYHSTDLTKRLGEGPATATEI